MASIGEPTTALSNDELYTIVTNKAAKGRKSALVAMVKGTLANRVEEVLSRLSLKLRKRVQEVTLDMAANMNLIVKRCFPFAHRLIDRFHILQLAGEAVQEIRIKYRWQATDEENDQIALARKAKLTYIQQLLLNGDSPKQLLARSRYLLFKQKIKWAPSQSPGIVPVSVFPFYYRTKKQTMPSLLQINLPSSTNFTIL